MEASAPFGGSALTLLEEPRGGLAALVILIFGLGTELEAAGGTGAVEDEELPETPWAFSADLEVEAPDNFSSRRRRICKTQPFECKDNEWDITWSIFSASGASGGAEGGCWSLSISGLLSLRSCLGIAANWHGILQPCRLTFLSD